MFFVAGAAHHVFLGPVVCYQYEASCERANEQPSRDANEARFQKLLVNAHISTKRSRSSVPTPPLSSPHCLDSDSDLTPKSARLFLR